jgi:hypothetical protein
MKLPRGWTPEEDSQLLVEKEAGKSTPAIAKTLNRTESSILGRLVTLKRREERAES